MEEFIIYALQFGTINPQQIDFILKRATVVELRKEVYFSEAGKVPKQVAFILEGVFRVCYYNNKGDEITRYFIDENNLMFDYVNFGANTTSSEYIQAVTDSKLLVFSKANWEDILDTILGWDKMLSKMVQRCLIQKIRKNPILSQNATTRYLAFMEKFPTLVNRIPLAYIASYLGITQQSLSRIRKSIR